MPPNCIRSFLTVSCLNIMGKKGPTCRRKGQQLSYGSYYITGMFSSRLLLYLYNNQTADTFTVFFQKIIFTWISHFFYNINVNAKNLMCLTYMYFAWSEIRDMVNLWMKVLSSWNYMDCHQVEWHSERCWGLQEMKKQKLTRSTSLQLSILRGQETWLAKPLKG